MMTAHDVASIEERHRQFERCVKRRNRIEMMAARIAIPLLALSGLAQLWGADNIWEVVGAIGLILVATGLAFSMWRLRQHSEQQDRSTGASPTAAYNVRVRRERDLLRSIWSWYIGPLIPGFLILWGASFYGGSVTVAFVGTIVTVAVIGWIAIANSKAADELDKQLLEVKA